MKGNNRHPRWVDVPTTKWNDWRWQLQNAISDARGLALLLQLDERETQEASLAAATFKIGVTPYYASLASSNSKQCPIRAQILPTAAELCETADERTDPLAEDGDLHLLAPGLTRRYPDRALLYLSHNCAVYCRHCNRRRKVGDANSAPSRDDIENAAIALESTPEIKDLLLSGGDPLSLSNDRLEQVISRMREIPHIEIIRIATRFPCTLPQRINPGLTALLRRHQPVYINTQFNSPRECTPEAATALEALADAGCPVGNQMVLLKGVNDDPEEVVALNRFLLRHRCRPYYIFQADAVAGTYHFRTPLAAGLNIARRLRGHVSGLAIPHLVIDLPGGGGKVPISPDYLVSQNGNRYTFRNYAGELFEYVEGAVDV